MSVNPGKYTLVAENGAKVSGTKKDIGYDVRVVKEFPKSGDTPFSSTPALSPENSFQFNLSGKTEQPSMTFKMIDNGNDRSDTNFTSTTFSDIDKIADGLGYSTFSDSRFDNNNVKTPKEQSIWLRDYIHNNALPITWRIYGGEYTDKLSSDAGTPIVITQAEPRPSPRPNEIRFVVRFQLGKRVI